VGRSSFFWHNEIVELWNEGLTKEDPERDLIYFFSFFSMSTLQSITGIIFQCDPTNTFDLNSWGETVLWKVGRQQPWQA
jgi:hypothetical protein